MPYTRIPQETELLRLCREARGLEPGQAFLALLQHRLTTLRHALVHADSHEFHGLQGAAQCLERIIADIQTDPAPRDGRDGAYS